MGLSWSVALVLCILKCEFLLEGYQKQKKEKIKLRWS